MKATADKFTAEAQSKQGKAKAGDLTQSAQRTAEVTENEGEILRFDQDDDGRRSRKSESTAKSGCATIEWLRCADGLPREYIDQR